MVDYWIVVNIYIYILGVLWAIWNLDCFCSISAHLFPKISLNHLINLWKWSTEKIRTICLLTIHGIKELSDRKYIDKTKIMWISAEDRQCVLVHACIFHTWFVFFSVNKLGALNWIYNTDIIHKHYILFGIWLVLMIPLK